MSSSRHSSVIVVCVDKNICPQKHRSRLFIERKQHNNNIVCGHCTTTCTHATIILDMQLHSSNQKHIMWNRAVHFVERQPKVKLYCFCTAFQDPIASCANFTINVCLFRLATTSTSILLQLNCSASATVARQRLYGRFG